MKDILRYIVIGALFLIPFLPLYVANGSFFPFITGKGFGFRILVEIALAAWIVLALMDARYRPRFSWVLALYGALTLWMLIADLAAPNAFKAFWSNYERMDGWITLIHAFAFFVVAGSFLTAERLWRSWWMAFITGAALVCGYGLLQVMGAAEIHQGGVRLDATFGNAAYLAAYLLFAIAITLWRAFESAKGLRYALLALAAIEVLLLFYTATRGAILGFALAAVLTALLWAVQSSGRSRTIALSMLAALIVLAAGFWLARESAFVTENGTLARLASVSLESGAPRLAIWSMAGEGIMERPVLGWGQEGFNHIFNTHYKPSMFAQEQWFDRAHNVFLDWAVAGGIPALLLFLALLITSIVLLYSRGAESSKAERVFLTGALAAYAFQALFVFDNLFTYVPLAAIFAMAHAARARDLSAVMRPRPLSESAATTFAAPVAIVGLVVILWVVNVPSMLAANRLVAALSQGGDVDTGLALFKEAAGMGSFARQEIAEQAVAFSGAVAPSSAVPPASKAAVVNYAIAQMGAEIERYPDDARLRLQYASAFRAAGDYERAIAETEVARTLSPRKQQIFIQEGMLEWERGNKAEAAALFTAAYELDPSFTDLAIYKAVGELITGNNAASDQTLFQAFGTTTVSHDALVFAYYDAKRYADLVRIWELRAQTGGPDVKYQLAFAYKVAGRTADARAVTEKTMKEHPESVEFGKRVLAEISAP